MNFNIFSHLFNYGIRINIAFAFIICLISDHINTEDDGPSLARHSYTQSHNNRRHSHHNRQYHNFRRNFSYKIQDKSDPKTDPKSDPLDKMGRNQRDFQSSRRVSYSSRFSWNKKLVPPLSPSSILFDEPSSPKVSRRRNSTSKLPNIIFILTDDQDIELGSMDFMPKTSKILGEGGAHFPNAYVTTPMCCPSRSSSLTGLYVHNHNVYTNNDNCSSQYWQNTYETRTFASYLNNAGYRTAFFGKYLNEYNGSYIPQGWREWSALVRNSRFYNYTLNVNGNKVKHGDVYELDYYPDLIINDSLQFLRYSKRFFANKPLMMVLSFPGPHGPEDSAPQFQNLFLNVTTHRTPSWNYAPNTDKQWLLRNTGKMEPIHEDFTDLLHTKRLQTLQSVDESVEKLYNELVEIGELDNTYIFYTSDHGYHLGQFGLVKGKAMPFEFDVRVPFYVRGPKITGGQKSVQPKVLVITGMSYKCPLFKEIKESVHKILFVISELVISGINNIVLNIDLAPTFLDIAKVKVPDHMDGNSMLPLLKNSLESEKLDENLHQKSEWRDTFIIERGKSTRETDNDILTLSKKQWLQMECQKPEYRFPCSPYQKFECFFDGNEMRIRKCRKSYWSKDINRKFPKRKCICPSEQTTDDFFDQQSEDHFGITTSEVLIKSKKRRLDSIEKKLQRRFLKEHVINRNFRPVFIGSRTKRDLDIILNDGFDVDGVYQLNKLLEASTSKTFNDSATFSGVQSFNNVENTTCVILSNLSVSCSDEIYQNKHIWREKKDRLDSMIKKLQLKLVQLKGIRRHLNQKRPLLQGFNRDNYQCDCNHKNSYRRDRFFTSRYGKRKRFRFHERHQRKEKKLRRRTKFENTTCNYEKMNCFTHDNHHWKTAPFWTKGPFCFCQNSNNNSFWCLRTINSTHNFLYCEFITGFITYYNLLQDPYQLRNSIYDLEFNTLEELRRRLNKLKNCSGAKECTIKYRIPSNNINDSNLNLNYFSKSRSERKIISI